MPTPSRPRPRVRIYPVLVSCIEEGLAYGYRRAHKHTDTPDESLLCEHIEREILNLLCERLNLDDD